MHCKWARYWSRYKIDYPALGMSENDGCNDSGPKMVTSMLKVWVVDKIQACENDYLDEFLHESIKRKFSSYRFCIKFHYRGMLQPLLFLLSFLLHLLGSPSPLFSTFHFHSLQKIQGTQGGILQLCKCVCRQCYGFVKLKSLEQLKV